MQLGTVLNDLARDLNDAEEGHEFATWSRAQLTGYLNEGLCHAFTTRPNDFVSTVVLKLDPGRVQAPCDCMILHQILGQCDGDGNLLGPPIPRRSDAVTFQWTKPGCPPRRAPGGGFRLSGYNADSKSTGLFTVTPAVPPNVDVYLLAECSNPPGALDAGSLDTAMSDCRTLSAAKQWAIFRALMVENESANAVQVASVHLQVFFKLLDLQYTKEMAQQLGVPGGVLPGLMGAPMGLANAGRLRSA
jgi:hypothetical protein